jgi:hypothetical protein
MIVQNSIHSLLYSEYDFLAVAVKRQPAYVIFLVLS